MDGLYMECDEMWTLVKLFLDRRDSFGHSFNSKIQTNLTTARLMFNIYCYDKCKSIQFENV